MQRSMTFGLVLLLVLVVALPVWAQDDDPVMVAVDYLVTTQNEDGGFSTGWAPESDIATTADVVVAAWTADRLEEDFVGSAINYLEAQVAGDNVSSAGSIAKVVIALVAYGADPAEFGERNLIDDLLATQDKSGVIGYGAFDHCLALIALQDAAVSLPDGALDAALAAQGEDGGWGFMAGEAADTNTTGLCLQALAVTDETDAVAAGFEYLATIQNEDGGWPYQSPSDFGTDSDTNSTALVVQALIANGADLDEWNNPQDWLLTLQNDSGSFSYQAAVPGDNILATVAVIPAVAGLPLNLWALETVE